METFDGIGKKPYSVERFMKHPEVIETRALIDEGMEHFLTDLHENVHPSINQILLFEALSASPVTSFNNPSLHEVGAAISGARLETASGDTAGSAKAGGGAKAEGDFSTYNEILGSAIPLRGTALETQLRRLKKHPHGTHAGLVARSAINPEQTILGFPAEGIDRRAVGMAQVAISREVARELAVPLATPGARESHHAATPALGLAKARVLWQGYNQIIGEQITTLHSLHQRFGADEPYLEALEIATPKVAPNSIALTFDLVNSTERALAKNNGAFTHFLGAWKRNLAKIIDYHELTKTTELIGDLGDGYSVIFWLGKETDIYSDEDIEAFHDLVVTPFTESVQAMSAELAAQYTADLGPLIFDTAETPTFTYVNSPTDISAEGLWTNARKLK